MTRLLDGRPIAARIEAEVAARAASLAARGRPACLAILLLGDDAPSRVYGSMIRKGCERARIAFQLVHLAGLPSRSDAEGAIARLNADRAVHAILIKRPLPGELADEAILQRIRPDKDVDGCHFENVGRLVIGAAPMPVPCTPAGVVELLRSYGYPPDGRHVVVIGRSATVGKPLANLLGQRESGANATVTLCHRATTDLAEHTRRADVVIVAIGSPAFLRADMVDPGAVVIDVGTNAVSDPGSAKGYCLRGDADFEGLLGRCAALTPVPGGVGPVTVAMLLKGVVDLAERLTP